jgi:magnesium transporter
MLSESHPTYLQNLRIDFLRARAKGDFAAYVLAVVAVGVVPPSVVIGMHIY